MPNWCSGVLKVRGKKKDLLNFIQNGIEEVIYINGKLTSKSVDFQLDEFGDLYINLTRKDIYIKDTRRCFIIDDIEWHWDDNNKTDLEKTYIQCLDVHQAWYLEKENFKEISKQYNIDFRIIGFECGMQFTQEIEVKNGDITLYKESKYDDYEWEVYDPRLGG